MIAYPKLGMPVALYGHALHSHHALYGHVRTIIKKRGMGYSKGELLIRKLNGDIVKVHRAWLYEYKEKTEHVTTD